MTPKYPDWEGFTRAVMEEWHEHWDLDAADKFDLALKFDIIREIPGGFNPLSHYDEYGAFEPGDPWYELNYPHERIPRATANPGTYWRIAFSKSWKERHPWSLHGIPMPYIGFRRFGATNSSRFWSFGPFSLIAINVPKIKE